MSAMLHPMEYNYTWQQELHSLQELATQYWKETFCREYGALKEIRTWLTFYCIHYNLPVTEAHQLEYLSPETLVQIDKSYDGTYLPDKFLKDLNVKAMTSWVAVRKRAGGDPDYPGYWVFGIVSRFIAECLAEEGIKLYEHPEYTERRNQSE